MPAGKTATNSTKNTLIFILGCEEPVVAPPTLQVQTLEVTVMCDRRFGKFLTYYTPDAEKYIEWLTQLP